MTDKLSEEAAEAIRVWCLSDEGQRQIRKMLGDIRMATNTLRKERMLSKGTLLRVIDAKP